MKKQLIILGIIGILPLSVKAANYTAKLECEKKLLSPGETTTCKITGTTDGEISGFEGNVVLGDDLSYDSFSCDKSIWNGVADGEGQHIMVTTDGSKDLTGNFEIGSFVIKAGNKAGISTSVSINGTNNGKAYYSTGDSVDVPVDVNSETIKVTSPDNTLKKLALNSEDITLSAGKTSFDVTVNQKQALINIETNNSNAKISGTYNGISLKTGENNIILNYGLNQLNIVVTAENGDKRTYSLNITRPEIRELTSLKINNEEIKLTSGTYKYDYKVENDITSVKIAATANTGSTKFVSGFDSRTINDLKVGKNEVLIKVADADGKELVYTININRLDKDGKDIVPVEEKTDNNKSENTNTNTNTKSNENKSVNNPKTGVYGISISLILISAIGYIVVKKKDLFKKKI